MSESGLLQGMDGVDSGEVQQQHKHIPAYVQVTWDLISSKH